MIKSLKTLSLTALITLFSSQAISQDSTLIPNSNPNSPFTQKLKTTPWKIEGYRAIAIVAGINYKHINVKKVPSQDCQNPSRTIYDAPDMNVLSVDFKINLGDICYKLKGNTALNSSEVRSEIQNANLYFPKETNKAIKLFNTRIYGYSIAQDFFQSIDNICKDNKQISPYVKCFKQTLKVKAKECEQAIGHIYDTTNHPNNQPLRDSFIKSAKHLCQDPSGKDINKTKRKVNYLFFQTKL